MILILMMIVMGGSFQLFKTQGSIGYEISKSSFFGRSPLKNSLLNLEQIARFSHDYLNGFLCGENWGTVLSEDQMKEEMEQLYFRYELEEEMISYLYPQGMEVDPLFHEFRSGFELVIEGLEKDDKELLKQAHEIFHRIDYDIFHHSSIDKLIIVD